MKKIILLSFLIAPTFLGMGNILAQPKGSPNYDKTGGWVHYTSTTDLKYQNPLGPGDAGYPSIKFADGSKYAANKVFSDKLIALRNIFKEAYPNPQGACITYNLKTNSKEKPADVPRFFSFYLNAFQLQNDGVGGLKQLDVANDNPGMYTGVPPNYDGLFSVFINQIPHDEQYGFFEKQKQFDEILKTKQIPNVSGIYMMPPQNNFQEKASYNTAAVYKNMAIPKADNANSELDKYTVFRFVEYFNDGKYGLVERHMDKIIMTSYNKLPYKPLTRKEFISVLQLQQQTQLTKFKQQKIPDNQKDKDLYKRDLLQYENILKALDKLLELNQNDLDKPASLQIAHKNIVNDLYGYAYNSKNYPELQINKLQSVFTEEIKNAYTPCKLIKYYKSSKDEDLQTIMINWYYELPVGNNPKANEHPSMDSRSFYMAIKNKLDWSKLDALLMKVK